MSTRNEKLKEALMHAAAEFLSREAGPQSLITVTNIFLSEDGHRCNIFITVMPEEAEAKALEFANRNRREFADFFQTRVRGAQVPHLEFLIDRGEKNRQRLDELGA